MIALKGSTWSPLLEASVDPPDPGALPMGPLVDTELVEGPRKTCRQCFQEYTPRKSDDGLCSEACASKFDRQLAGQAEDEGP